MKVIIIGHSYVRDLQSLNKDEVTINNNLLQFEYYSVPGAHFDTFLNEPAHVNYLQTQNPDIIVIILGGNDITNKKSNSEIYAHCREFYKILREKLPNSILIGAQIEKRYIRENNRWDVPCTKIFDQRRSTYNNFLHRLKVKSCAVLVQGPGRLYDRKYYGSDGIHLNDQGRELYFVYIIGTIRLYLTKSENKY